jgi:hypothetical protein
MNGVLENQEQKITLVAKFGKERITLEDVTKETTIGQVKDLLSEQTGVLPKRQKLIGLTVNAGGSSKVIGDNVVLADLKVKPGKKSDPADGIVHHFLMMGTPEENIFVDPSDKDDLPDVVDDFDLDFNAGSSEARYKIVCNFYSVECGSHAWTLFDSLSLFGIILWVDSGYNMSPMATI